MIGVLSTIVALLFGPGFDSMLARASNSCEKHLLDPAVDAGQTKDAIVNAAVGVIIREDGRRLILRRRADDRSFPGQWSLPGGQVDISEKPEQAVVREVFEETGLQAKVLRKIGIRQSIEPVRDRTYIIHIYLLQVPEQSSAIRLSTEHSDHRWVNALEANQLGGIAPIAKELLLRQDF